MSWNKSSKYSFTLSLTSALYGGWMVNATPPAALPPGKDPVPIVQEDGWTPGPFWTAAENLAPAGFRSLDRPARSESLHRLSCHGPRVKEYPHKVHVAAVATYTTILLRKIQVHVNKKTYRHFSEEKSVREGCFQQNRNEFYVGFWRASGVGKRAVH